MAADSNLGTYTKDGEPDRQALDQAEVNDLIWRGYQLKAAPKAKKTTAAADAPAADAADAPA